MRRECRWPGNIALLVPRLLRIVAAWLQRWPGPRYHRRSDRSRLRPPEYPRQVSAGGAAWHSDGILAQRWSVAQRVCDGKLHRRTGRGGEAGRGRLSAGSLGNRRAPNVLELAAEKSGWDSLPAGQGRGLSVHIVFGTYLAQVAEVEVAKDGSVRVRRVVCAVDCGRFGQPRHGQGANGERSDFRHHRRALWRDHAERRPCRAKQLRQLPDAAHRRGAGIEVHIVQSPEAPGGMGEPGTSAIVPAVANAIFAATGKRLRKLPIDADALKQPA